MGNSWWPVEITSIPILSYLYRNITIKFYLRYKTITSQNVPSEAQVKNSFISYKSYVPFARYWSFCTSNHLMIYQIGDAMMNITFQFSNLLQLLSNQLCQDSIVSLKTWIKDIWRWQMSAIKNGHISLCWHFNKIIKAPGTSFHWAKNVRIVYHTTH